MFEQAFCKLGGRSLAGCSGQFMVIAAVALFATEAWAQSAEGRVRAGRSGVVAEHYHLIRNGCRSGPTPAGSGAPAAAPRSRRDARADHPARHREVCLNVGACAGRTVRATVVRYTAGRRPGSDTFAYDFTFPRDRVTRSKTVRVTIQ